MRMSLAAARVRSFISCWGACTDLPRMAKVSVTLALNRALKYPSLVFISLEVKSLVRCKVKLCTADAVSAQLTKRLQQSSALVKACCHS